MKHFKINVKDLFNFLFGFQFWWNTGPTNFHCLGNTHNVRKYTKPQMRTHCVCQHWDLTRPAKSEAIFIKPEEPCMTFPWCWCLQITLLGRHCLPPAVRPCWAQLLSSAEESWFCGCSHLLAPGISSAGLNGHRDRDLCCWHQWPTRTLHNQSV